MIPNSLWILQEKLNSTWTILLLHRIVQFQYYLPVYILLSATGMQFCFKKFLKYTIQVRNILEKAYTHTFHDNCIIKMNLSPYDFSILILMF
jgi:hypothetical protein